ncbi:hypothetical protein BHE74_00047496, partial [Ensete ventricosum]
CRGLPPQAPPPCRLLCEVLRLVEKPLASCGCKLALLLHYVVARYVSYVFAATDGFPLHADPIQVQLPNRIVRSHAAARLIPGGGSHPITL